MGKGTVSDNISEQAPNEGSECYGKRKIAHHPLIVNILPFYCYYSLPNDTAHYETFILSSSTSSAGEDIVAAPSSFLAICLLKVFVCKMNCCSGRRDDSLHEDDIELISEMLQNGLVDVYHET